MLKNLIQKKETLNKKGVTSIEIVVSVLIIVIVVCGFVDLTGILSRTNTMAMNTAYISRVVGSQGGVQTSQISNFSGRYVNSNELYNNVKRSMNSSGIEDDEWEVKIDGVRLTPTTNLRVVDYGSRLPVEVTIGYQWYLTRNYLPGEMKGTKTSKSNVSTTFKIRDGFFSQD